MIEDYLNRVSTSADQIRTEYFLVPRSLEDGLRHLLRVLGPACDEHSTPDQIRASMVQAGAYAGLIYELTRGM